MKTTDAVNAAHHREIGVRGTAPRASDWARERVAWLGGWLPYRWRVLWRWRLHAALGSPVPPLPFARARRDQVRILSPPASPGVNLLGYARGEFGVAECLRAYARALAAAGYPFDVFNFDVGAASRQQNRSMDPYLSDTLHHATNVFFVNADQMPIARHLLGAAAFRGHRNVGLWLWELEKFPRDWHWAFELVDEVWAPTRFVRDAIAAATAKPVLRMPMPVEFDPPVGMDRAALGLPGGEFIFLFSYDFNGFRSRKNPEAAIAAFRQAFGDGARGVRLLLKSTNGARFPGQLEALQRSVADDPRIEVRDGFLAREAMFALQNAVDCFVSLHRSEGFGLNIAECMYLGKPVIATGYSGNMDFMDRDNSLPVDYRLIPLRKGEYPYWQDQHWADPDVAQAARLMRQVFEDRGFAGNIGAAAAASIRRTHSRAACAALVTMRLRAIDGRHVAR